MSQKFRSVIEKEFRIFFNSAIGYVFLVVFLGFSGWMFFRTFFLFGQAEMRSFFLLLPWTFLFLVPALSMRSWSEEFRSGTIEILFTSGFSPAKIALAKFVAGIGFLTLALGLTLPFAFAISSLGNLDWGVVWISYLGALLLGASYLAIGQMISACARNQIVAFLLSVLVCFAFYILGEPFVTAFFPGFFGKILGSIGLGAHFKSIVRGVIDSRDIVFYISFLSIFLTANIVILRQKFASGKIFFQAFFAGVVVISILANIASAFVFARFDGTEGKNYTLSETSKKIVRELEVPVRVLAFFSKNIPAQMQKSAQNVRDFLGEYSARASGNFSVEFLDPSDEKIEEMARNFGIPPLQIQVVERDQQKVVQARMGIAVVR